MQLPILYRWQLQSLASLVPCNASHTQCRTLACPLVAGCQQQHPADDLPLWSTSPPPLGTCDSACWVLLVARVATAGLFPAPIFGPILGVLAVFIADRGDLTDVRRKLFPDHKGQFKSG